MGGLGIGLYFCLGFGVWTGVQKEMSEFCSGKSIVYSLKMALLSWRTELAVNIARLNVAAPNSIADLATFIRLHLNFRLSVNVHL